jgi:hypothetical protein
MGKTQLNYFFANSFHNPYTLPKANTEDWKQIFPENELIGQSPISTFMCLGAIIGSVHIFLAAE